MSEDPRKYLLIQFDVAMKQDCLLIAIDPAKIATIRADISAYRKQKLYSDVEIMTLAGSSFIVDTSRIIYYGFLCQEDLDGIIDNFRSVQDTKPPWRPREEPDKLDNPWPMLDEQPDAKPSLYDVMTGRKPQPPDTSPQDEGE